MSTSAVIDNFATAATGAALSRLPALPHPVVVDEAHTRSLVNVIHDDPKLVAGQRGHTVDVDQNVFTRASAACYQRPLRVIEGDTDVA